MAKSIFPEGMLNKASSEMTLDSILSKLVWFEKTLHLVHLQTTGYAEHTALGASYDYLHDFQDNLLEKLMGYTGRRVNGYKVDPIISTNANMLASDIMAFATSLKSYGEANGFHDVCNMSDDLSGHFAKLRYLLTLS